MVCAGSAYTLQSGKKVPFSILGALCTDLSVPYNPATGFPFHTPGIPAERGLQGPLHVNDMKRTGKIGSEIAGAPPPMKASMAKPEELRDVKIPIDCPGNAHFMAMCAKLIYEDARIVKDVITNK